MRKPGSSYFVILFCCVLFSGVLRRRDRDFSMKKLIQIFIIFGLVGLLFGCGGEGEKSASKESATVSGQTEKGNANAQKKIELAEKLESPRLEDCGSSKNTSNVPNPIMCSHHITMMKSFVDNLKNGEVDEVVGQIAYPITFWESGKQIGLIDSAEQFKKYYDFIFPKELISKISEAFSQDTEYFWNNQGMMFGGGAVWFHKENGKVKTINLRDDNLIKEMMIEISNPSNG